MADLLGADRLEIEEALGKLLETRGLIKETPLGVENADLLAAGIDPVVEVGELILELHDLVLHLKHDIAAYAHEQRPEERRKAHHAAFSQTGAAVRSAARSRAERARGLRSISAAPGVTGLRVMRRKLGAAVGRAGRWREPRGAASLRSRRNSFTVRSSSEWKETIASLPPGSSSRSAARRARSSSPGSSFTSMRSAWKVRVAGSMPPLDGTTARTMRASSAVRVTGASRRAATMARATRRAKRSSP